MRISSGKERTVKTTVSSKAIISCEMTNGQSYRLGCMPSKGLL